MCKLSSAQMEKIFEIKTQVIGSGRGVRTGSRRTTGEETDEVQEGRLLNRTVRWTQMGGKWNPISDSRAVSTPGGSEARHEEEENAKPLSAEMASHYRALSAWVLDC